MNSPLKKIAVFDFETGGLDSKINPITEMAVVVIDCESLKIIDEMTLMIYPYLDLRSIFIEPIKEAKRLFNLLATPGEEGRVKSLPYRRREITLKSLEDLSIDIELFHSHLKKAKLDSCLLTYENYLEFREIEEIKDVAEVYFNSCYNPKALEVTNISIDELLKDGIPYTEACETFKNFLTLHTVGTYKPIVSGHNIEGFDLDFADKLFLDCKLDFRKFINRFTIDTLDWVRLRWIESPSFSLGVCANTLGLTLKEAHRALPDTIANAKVLIALLKSLRGEGSQETTYVRRKFDFNF